MPGGDRSGADLTAWLDQVAVRARAAYPGDPRNWAYGTAPEQVVDLWGDPGAPAVVAVVHGGYFAAEYDRSGTEALCRHLAAAGYAVANVEYRRTGSCPDPLDSVRDVRAAVRSVREQCRSDRLVVVGHSAGGYLALTASPETGVVGVCALAPATLLRAVSVEGYDDGLVAAWIGRTVQEDPGAWDRMRPERVGLGRVPLQILHGERDGVVPVTHSVVWVGEQVAQGRQVDLRVLAGTGHYEFLDPASAATATVLATVSELLSPG